MKKIFLFFVSIVAIALMCVPTQCSTLPTDIPILDERTFPEEIQFSVNDSKTEHVVFAQASVNIHGWFAVRYRAEGVNHIAIYDENGIFQKELRYISSSYHAMRLSDQSVEIFFHDYVIIYSIPDQCANAYEIPSNYIVSSEFGNNLNTQDVFHIGEWEYRCKESLGGYTAIVRENGNTQETVFSLAGASPSAAQLLVSFGIAIVICLLIFYIQKKRYSGGQWNS